MVSGYFATIDSAEAGFGVSADLKSISSTADFRAVRHPLRKDGNARVSADVDAERFNRQTTDKLDITRFANRSPIQTSNVEVGVQPHSSASVSFSANRVPAIRQQQISILPRLLRSFLIRDGIDDLVSSTSVQTAATEIAIWDVLRESAGSFNPQDVMFESSNRASTRIVVQDSLDGMSAGSRLSFRGRELPFPADDNGRNRFGAVNGSALVAVPEPGSLAVWVGIGLFGLRRSMTAKRRTESNSNRPA